MIDFKKLDKTDREIIDILQNDPEITNVNVGKMVKKSQAAVGARIIKLKRQGLLRNHVGVNLNDVSTKIAFVEIETRDKLHIAEKIKNCPFIINAFSKTGIYDVSLMMNASNVKILENILDRCFRSDPSTVSVKVDYLISPIKDFMFPVNLAVAEGDHFSCNYNCVKKKSDINKLRDLVKEVRTKSVKTRIKEVAKESIEIVPQISQTI